VLIFQLILAGLAVVAVARDPNGRASVACVGVLGLLSAALGAPVLSAVEAVLPVLLFLAAALTLAAAADRAGLAERSAARIARLAGGRTAVVYALVCLTTAAATAALSLDGAVVLTVPLVLALARRHGLPLPPLLIGTVVVANAVSVAVPQGNPTNLVVIERLDIEPSAFLGDMLVPGLVGALACAVAVALMERHALAGGYARPPAPGRTPFTRAERHLILVLAGAALSCFLAPLAGIAPWWPFTAVALAGLLLHPRPLPRPSLPFGLAVRLTGLLVLIGALHLSPPPPGAATAVALLAVAVAVGAGASLTNNLPASVSVGSLLGAGPSAYAATLGLGIGALAMPQGSVATLIAVDLAGPDATSLTVRRLAPVALTGLVAATLALAL
jgi:arsenical pump membrane protein